MAKAEITKAKIAISLDLETEAYVIDFAKKMGLTKSGAINVLINQARQYNASVESLPALLKTIADLNKE